MDRALLGYQRRNRGTPVSVAYLLRAAGACDIATLRGVIQDRAERFPVLTHRVTPTGGPASRPVWAPDPRFDASAHVWDVRLPPGADETDARSFASRRCGAPIPLDAPPWELSLLRAPGAEEFYVLFRASHIWLDGTALHQVLTMLFGTGAVPPARWLREGRVSPRSLAKAGGRLLGWATPTGRLEALARPTVGELDLFGTSTSVERLRAVSRAYGATVNDVFLVALAGAFGRWSRPVGGSLRTLMPVSTRRPGENDLLGNFVVGTRVALPCGPASPSRRFDVVRRQTLRYQRGSGAGAGERWWFERLPTRLGRTAVAMGMDPRRVAVSTSNLGVLPALAIGGNQVTEALPVPVLVPGQRMFVMLGGLGATATVGIAADRNVPDSANLATLWLAELDAMAQAAGLDTVPAQAPGAPADRRTRVA